MSPSLNKYLKCHWCNCIFLEINTWKHDVCKEFYRFTINELVCKLEEQLDMAKQLQNQLI